MDFSRIPGTVVAMAFQVVSMGLNIISVEFNFISIESQAATKVVSFVATLVKRLYSHKRSSSLPLQNLDRQNEV
jgi:hypothetical protein